MKPSSVELGLRVLSDAFLSFPSCIPHFIMGLFWEHFLNKSFVYESLSQYLLLRDPVQGRGSSFLKKNFFFFFLYWGIAG